ncbi:MAG: 30S ribosomal protein S9 [Patescibacteria group bacterium]
MIKKPADTHKKTKNVTHPVREVSARSAIYLEAVGRRKTAIARVRFFASKADGKNAPIIVNDRDFKIYFPLKKLQGVVLSPLEATATKDYHLTVKVSGGGPNAQAEAVRLGIARTLVSKEAANRPRLKTLGYLMRDPRMVERKKFGSRKARRPQQWRKR